MTSEMLVNYTENINYSNLPMKANKEYTKGLSIAIGALLGVIVGAKIAGLITGLAVGAAVAVALGAILDHDGTPKREIRRKK